MSEQYNEYLSDHIKYVQEAYDWLSKQFPDISEKMDGFVGFDHDGSKFNQEEYDAYDRYFYGNKSFKVKQDFDYAWLHHIHNNPHHWQYWVLINDDDGKNKPLEIPYKYAIEMICDWWSFSFKKGKLEEIFDWYDDHKDKMILHPNTRKLVEDILNRIRKKLEDEKEGDHLEHYGIPGQKWGVKNGPPYPINGKLKNKTPAEIKKLDNYNGKLYWISEKDFDGQTIDPRIPSNYFTKHGYEDNTTKRVCFAPSVGQCLTALSQNVKGKHYIVYEPEEMPSSVYKPNKGAVPDSDVTGELWVTEPVKLKRVNEIKVIGDDGKDGMKFEYGEDKQAELYGWNYEELKKR